jgi:hypothetical protein
MHRVKTFTLILLLGFVPFGLSAGDLGPLEPLADFHRAVHESLGLPEPLIVRLLEQGAPDEQLPVIGLIAERAHVAPERIFDMHRAGTSFLDISIHFGLGPEIFYVPIERDPGPPYGKAWGYYKKTPRAKWNTIVLSDSEIVHFANLKLVVDRYGVPAGDVIALQHQGKPFVAIHGQFAHDGHPGEPGHGKDKGKSKGKKKDKGHGHGRSRGLR